MHCSRLMSYNKDLLTYLLIINAHMMMQAAASTRHAADTADTCLSLKRSVQNLNPIVNNERSLAVAEKSCDNTIHICL